MSKLHPHWRATDENSEEIPVRIKGEEASENVATVSRRPAAVIGILLVTALGITFFQGVTNLVGQLTGEVVIHITDNGFEPRDATAEAGKPIRWINYTSLPEMLNIGELCGKTWPSECQSDLIFPNESYTFTLPADLSFDSYNYEAQTRNFRGTFLILPPGSAPKGTPAPDLEATEANPAVPPARPVEPLPTPEPIPAPAPAPVPASEPTPEPAPSAVEEETLSALFEELESQNVTSPPVQPSELNIPLEGSTAPSVSQNLPTNPYTVGSNVSAPLPSTTEELHSGAPLPPPLAPRPISQPRTGAGGIVIIALLSIAALLSISKRVLRAEIRQ